MSHSECEVNAGRHSEPGEVNSGRNGVERRCLGEEHRENFSEDGAFTRPHVRPPCSPPPALPAAPPCRPRSSAQVGGASFHHADPRQDAHRHAAMPLPRSSCVGVRWAARARARALMAPTNHDRASHPLSSAHPVSRSHCLRIASAVLYHHHRSPPPPPTPHRQTLALTQTQRLPLPLTLTRQDRSGSRRPARRLRPRLPATASGGGPEPEPEPEP